MDTDYSKTHNDIAERDVIAACLHSSFIYLEVKERLKASLFVTYNSKKAYAAILKLQKQDKLPEIGEIGRILEADNVDIFYFENNEVPDLNITKQRIDYLEDLALRRLIFQMCDYGGKLACNALTTKDDFRGLYYKLGEILEDNGEKASMPFGEVVTGLMNSIADRMNDKEERGMMTGLRIFDSRFGLFGGDLLIVAGETSQGKSTLATTMAYNLAVAGVPSVFYSMEMSARQLAARIIARRVKIGSARTLKDKLSEAEFSQLYDNASMLKTLPIYFDERSKTTFIGICDSIRWMVREYGIRVAFIDYLQILANGKADNREQIIGDMARDLKRLAVETNTCIVALSQMSRSSGAKSEPTLSRMRGSGQIEEACDMALIIHRKSKDSEEAMLSLEKSRNGSIGKAKVRFDLNLSYIEDYKEGDPRAPYQERKVEMPF